MQAHHRDTPPRDDHVIEAGLLARGSAPSSRLPKVALSGTVGRWLAAYSCGGSSGIANGSPNSLLAQARIEMRPGNHDVGNLTSMRTRVKRHKDILISLRHRGHSGIAPKHAAVVFQELPLMPTRQLDIQAHPYSLPLGYGSLVRRTGAKREFGKSRSCPATVSGEHIAYYVTGFEGWEDGQRCKDPRARRPA